jgi:hypothetical protein
MLLRDIAFEEELCQTGLNEDIAFEEESFFFSSSGSCSWIWLNGFYGSYAKAISETSAVPNKSLFIVYLKYTTC